MDISRAWKAHFNVSDQKITLLEALKKELINEDQYFKWASQHYQIPVLDRSYFQSQEVSSELWDKFKNLKSWNSALVPVGEWDGALYVGCLEPSLTDLQDKKSSIVFVLVSHESLESVWLNFNSQKTSDTPSHEKFLEDQTKMKEEKIFSLVKEQPVSENKSNATESEVLASEKEQPPFQSDENLNVQEQEVLSLTKEQPISDMPKEEKKIDSMMEGEGLDDDHFEIDQGKGNLVKGVLSKMVGLIVNDPSKKKVQPLKKSKKVASDLSMEEVEEDLASEGVVKVELEKPESMGSIKDDLSLEKENLEVAKEESSEVSSMRAEDDSQKEKKGSSQVMASFVDSTGTSHMSVLVKDKNKSDESDNSPSAVRLILENTKKYVDSYIMFTFSGSKFKPVKWSYNLTPQNKNPISVKRPSFFRIAYVSKEYYHGHVPPILGNTEFFEAWGFSTPPHQILFIPFVEGETIFGGYLGIVSKNIEATPEEVSSIIIKATLPLRKHYKIGA